MAGKTRIFYPEARKALLGGDLAEQLDAIVRCDWAEAPWLHRYCKPCRPQLRSVELRTQRDRTMAVARLALDPADDAHERMLMTIYCSLTGDATWPPRYGTHWEVVGFQGNDPATDLRGVGMLALLQAAPHRMCAPRVHRVCTACAPRVHRAIPTPCPRHARAMAGLTVARVTKAPPPTAGASLPEDAAQADGGHLPLVARGAGLPFHDSVHHHDAALTAGLALRCPHAPRQPKRAARQ